MGGELLLPQSRIEDRLKEEIKVFENKVVDRKVA